MNRKWIIACLIIAPCGVAGAVAWHLTEGSIDWLGHSDSGDSPGYVRIELPAVRIVELNQVTDADATVMLRDSIDRNDPPPFPQPAPPPTLAIDETARGQVQTERPEVVAAPAGELAGMLAVRYDLSGETADSRDTFEVRKGVRFNGRDAGQATIRVGSGSTLLIASEDLRTLLAAADRTDLAGGLSAQQDSFIDFDEVRKTGLNVRYDAVSDRILISS